MAIKGVKFYKKCNIKKDDDSCLEKIELEEPINNNQVFSSLDDFKEYVNNNFNTLTNNGIKLYVEYENVDKSWHYKYKGEINKEGLPNGYGSHEDIGDGSKYIGEWENDRSHGKGTYTWADGTTYKGDWVKGKKHGKGKFTFNDGDIYEGEWKNNKIEGKGKYTWPDGKVYDGDWKNDKREGKGKYTWPDGKVYDGDWSNDKREGKGIFTYKNSNKYIGEWKNNKIDGKGSYFLKNLNIIATGNFTYKQDNSLTRTFTTLTSTENNLVYDCKNKNIKINFNNGPSSIKEDNNDENITTIDISKFNLLTTENDETTTVFFPNGTMYEGQFKEGEFEGKGKITYPDGSIFKGKFTNGVCNNGVLTITETDGEGNKQEIHYFLNDYNIYQSNIKNIPLKEILDKNYTHFKGKLDDNLDYNGKGILTYPNGDKIEGNFVKGKLEGERCKITWSDGSSYTGTFNGGRSERDGILILEKKNYKYEHYNEVIDQDNTTNPPDPIIDRLFYCLNTSVFNNSTCSYSCQSFSSIENEKAIEIKPLI